MAFHLLCADLGYAKEDQLDIGWKAIVDSLRLAMEDKARSMISPEVFETIKRAIAPKARDVHRLDEVKRFLLTGSTDGEVARGRAQTVESDIGGDSGSDGDNSSDDDYDGATGGAAAVPEHEDSNVPPLEQDVEMEDVAGPSMTPKTRSRVAKSAPQVAKRKSDDSLYVTKLRKIVRTRKSVCIEVIKNKLS
ncbi:hypothetical protein K3495_g6797 [Podosphaera aphanis]|nr:hypothetical protein K3495_g6797 [Podosphaera aphanis]